MIASVQPSMDASSNSRARRRCCLVVGIWASGTWVLLTKSPRSLGPTQRRDPVSSSIGDSHLHRSLGAGPITASSGVRKTKISPTPREFLAHTDFLHRLSNRYPLPLGHPVGGMSIPSPRGPSTLVLSLSATSAHCDRHQSRA